MIGSSTQVRKLIKLLLQKLWKQLSVKSLHQKQKK